MELTEFLLARIAEDEAVARESASLLLIIKTQRCAVIGSDEHRTYLHFDRHGPARVLAECEAKRRIVEWLPERTVLRLLALPHADHPDFRAEWKP